MIELTNLGKTYHSGKQTHTALHNVNLKIQAGSWCGIIGHSGAGKTTLIRCINLLERPSSGNITLNGEDLSKLTNSKLRAARRSIGKVFQHFNLLNSRNVFDNIALPLEITKTPKAEIKARVTALLDVVGLTERQHHYPAQLSGGQKQRVAIARALATKPHILLCDEPTSALDPETAQRILQLLQKIQREFNVTIIFVTHQVDIVKRYCDQVAILEQGRCHRHGKTTDILGVQ